MEKLQINNSTKLLKTLQIYNMMLCFFHFQTYKYQKAFFKPIIGGINMLKRITFRGLSFLVICVVLFSSISPVAFASDDWQSNFKLPKWTYITYVGGGVLQETDSLGRHKAGGDVILRHYDNIAEIEATVQRYNGGWHNTSYKWSARGNSGAGVSEYIYLNTGTYRVRLVIKVYSPSGTLLEETTLYTGETII